MAGNERREREAINARAINAECLPLAAEVQQECAEREGIRACQHAAQWQETGRGLHQRSRSAIELISATEPARRRARQTVQRRKAASGVDTRQGPTMLPDPSESRAF